LNGFLRSKTNLEETMKKHTFFAILLSMTLLVVPAHAAYVCSGTVTYLGFDSGSGTLTVAGPGGLPPIYICSMVNNTAGWTTETCKTAYATLLAAKLSGQTADIFFGDNLTCTTQPAWSTATEGNVYHVATQ
jgi:hypothetical protein